MRQYAFEGWVQGSRLRGAGLAGLLALVAGAAGAASFPAGDGPQDAAVADMDGDGVPDIVSSHAGSNDVAILLGNGDGTFQPAVFFPVRLNPSSVAVADLDGDENLDVVTSNSGNGSLGVLLGNGDGTLQPVVSLASGPIPLSVQAVDLDGDEVPDLAVANRLFDQVSVLLGNGDGSFGPRLAYPVGDAPIDVVVTDLDGDTVPDLAVANNQTGNGGIGDVSILLGNGDGSFQPALTFVAGLRPRALTAGDFDGDAILDLVVADVGEQQLSLLVGNGDGTFQPEIVIEDVGQGSAVDVEAADFDLDGFLDLATANASGDRATVLLGNGDGSFQPPRGFPTGDLPRSIAVARLDAGPALDLVTANLNSDDVTVQLNQIDPTLRPEIDILPWRDDNRVDPTSRRPIPVAILGSDDFDVRDVDRSTLAFGPAGAAPLGRRGGFRVDVNRDGFKDLLSLYRTRDTGIAFGDTEACVTGALESDRPLEGCDAIETSPRDCGRGFELALLVPLVLVVRRARRTV